MFSWMFHDQYGTINDLLMRIGMIDPAGVDRRADAVVVGGRDCRRVEDHSLHGPDAARSVADGAVRSLRGRPVDGASAWQRFKNITLS